MALQTTPLPHVLGCDVGKNSIVVHDSASGTTTTLANEPEQLAGFAAGIAADALVVCEATGGYEAELLGALSQAGRAAHRADARKVKAFIRSFGILGKTDAIDARALARYGQERHAQLPRWRPREAGRLRLQALLMARRDFVAQRVACNNRLKAPGAEPVRAYLQNLLDCLQAQIQAIDTEIMALVRQDRTLAQAESTLCTIAGIGHKTATALLALMPELGTLGRRQAAALAGLAPHPRQSGANNAYRPTRGGRAEVKRVLFMAALAAVRSNPDLRAFFKRLCANGKKKLVALTAVMRKLIVIANAKLRECAQTI